MHRSSSERILVHFVVMSEDVKALESRDAVFETISLLPIPPNMERLLITGMHFNEVSFIGLASVLKERRFSD